MKIKIPHLGYTVHVKDIAKTPYGDAVSYVLRIDNKSCEVYLKKNLKRIDTPVVAHELVHVLQLICEPMNIDFDLEKEHMGYLMQYMMNEILEYDYK
jgi:hypothetical protein